MGSVVTIGAYDGVHIGHRRVIAEVVETARTLGLESVVVTFDRHPAIVVRPASAPFQLTDLDQRLELLRGTGVDKVVVIEFTPDRAQRTAEEFVEEVLVGELGARVVVVGQDFHFGRGRSGDVALLREMGASANFEVRPHELVTDDTSHEIVSSTRIRRLVARGELEEASRLLGRPYELRGVVVGEASSFSGAGEGGNGVSVAVPDGILCPPAGGYDVLTGVVGSGGVPLEKAHVVVPGHGAALALLGTTEAWPGGARVRMLFDRSASTEG